MAPPLFFGIWEDSLFLSCTLLKLSNLFLSLILSADRTSHRNGALWFGRAFPFFFFLKLQEGFIPPPAAEKSYPPSVFFPLWHGLERFSPR